MGTLLVKAMLGTYCTAASNAQVSPVVSHHLGEIWCISAFPPCFSVIQQASDFTRLQHSPLSYASSRARAFCHSLGINATLPT